MLLFLHVDTRLPEGAVEKLLGRLATTAPVERRLVDATPRWGFFAVQLDDPAPAFRLIEWTMSVRSRATGIGTGDQALFVERALFWGVGGFPPIPLMEDVALSTKLKRVAGRPAWIPDPVTSSARYWQRHGILRSLLRMWRLRAAYWLGADPERLHAQYYR